MLREDPTTVPRCRFACSGSRPLVSDVSIRLKPCNAVSHGTSRRVSGRAERHALQPRDLLLSPSAQLILVRSNRWLDGLRVYVQSAKSVCTGECQMPKTSNTPARSKKVPKTYRLAPEKIAAAQRLLGASTATETIETALDLVLFRQELVKGTRTMLGVEITPPDAGSR